MSSILLRALGLAGWRPAKQLWIPVCTAIACLTATVFLSLAVLAKDRRNAQTSAVTLAGSLAGQIQGNMKSFVLAVTRMAHRLESAHELRQGEWEADADNYLRDIPGLAALARLDSDSVVRWVMPRKNSEKYIGRILNQDPARHRILQETRGTNDTRVSPVLELLGGGSGILMFSPIRRHDEGAGFLVAVFRVQGLWNSLLVDGGAKGYRIEVLEGQRRLYESMPATSVNGQLEAQSTVSLPGIVWTVRVQPPPESFILGGSPSTLAILLAGVIVSLLLPLNIAFAQAAGLRAKESEWVKGQLESQILERQKSEEVTRESEERFRLAFGGAPIGMALVTREGRWLRVNDSVCRMLGYSETELLATDFQTLTHPDDLNADLDLLTQVLAGDIESYSMDKRYFHKSGRIVNASLCVSYVKDQPGRPGYFVSQIMDISQRIEMDRVKNEFISTVSHELRTPLTSIAGSLGLVAGGVGGELPPKAAQLVQIAERNSHRLVRLIDDILYIEKAAVGRLEFDLEPQALAPIVRQAIEANQEYARGFGVEIELTRSVPDVIVRVDRDRLIQVLTNLISNAAKFSPQGSKVTLDIHEERGGVQVSVRDRGPGIAEAFRGRIFQQFAQADGAEARTKGGTGLGLSIAKVFMERLGGGIGYETVEGEGSTFFISLPTQGVISS